MLRFSANLPEVMEDPISVRLGHLCVDVVAWVACNELFSSATYFFPFHRTSTILQRFVTNFPYQALWSSLQEAPLFEWSCRRWCSEGWIRWEQLSGGQIIMFFWWKDQRLLNFRHAEETYQNDPEIDQENIARWLIIRGICQDKLNSLIKFGLLLVIMLFGLLS